MQPSCLHNGKIVTLNIGDRNQENPLGSKVLRRGLQDNPWIGQVLEAMPQGNHIEFPAQSPYGSGRVGRLDCLYANYVVQEEDTVWIDFDCGYVKSRIFRVAAENTHPGTDFQQASL
jgi:hypothetical protein